MRTAILGAEQDENPLILDSRSPKASVEDSMYAENRFKMLARSQPDAAPKIEINIRWVKQSQLKANDMPCPPSSLFNNPYLKRNFP
jgi:pyruvate-ferredoxin/flavodoxin oxidoreductase